MCKQALFSDHNEFLSALAESRVKRSGSVLETRDRAVPPRLTARRGEDNKTKLDAACFSASCGWAFRVSSRFEAAVEIASGSGQLSIFYSFIYPEKMREVFQREAVLRKRPSSSSPSDVPVSAV